MTVDGEPSLGFHHIVGIHIHHKYIKKEQNNTHTQYNIKLN